MSVAVRRALYGKMAGDSTLNALLGTPADGYTKSIYYQRAPADAGFPCIVFSKSSGRPRYALTARAYDNDLWLVKAIDRNNDTADPADNIAARLDELLTDGSLSISGRTQLYLRRESDVDYPETVDGETYRHSGFYLRFIYQ